MALINCPECGREVSSLAPACPHCGCPFIEVVSAPERRLPTAHGASRRGGRALAGCLVAVGAILVAVGVQGVKTSSSHDMSVLGFVGLGLALLGLFWWALAAPRVACNMCGHVGVPRTTTPGSAAIELVLWLFIIPGLIYSLWRWCDRHKTCAACGSTALVPEGTPRFDQIAREE